MQNEIRNVYIIIFFTFYVLLFFFSYLVTWLLYASLIFHSKPSNVLSPHPRPTSPYPPKTIPKMNSEEENRKRMYQQDDIDSALNSKRGTLLILLSSWREIRFKCFILGCILGILLASLGLGHLEVENFYFKVLCPQFVTGLIIGRGGSVINQLNSTCGAKIKLSQNNEFYPNTTDRILVCK